MIKAVIFDVGGVIHEDHNKENTEDVQNLLGVEKTIFELHYFPLILKLQKSEISEQQCWADLSSEVESKKNYSGESLFDQNYKKTFKLNKNVLDFAKKMKQSSIKTAILSNTIPSHSRFFLSQLPHNLFNPIVLSHDVGLVKPDPQIYTLTIDSLGVRPDQALFIDDIRENVEAAKKLGVQTIHLKSPPQLSQKIQKFGL